MLTDCPAASDREGEERHGDSPARRVWADQPLRFPGRAPFVAPSPGRFVTFRVRQWDRWGPGIGREQRRGSAGDAPPLPLAPCTTGDPTLITPVNDTLYSGEIKSLDRDWGIATRPENAISRELTSVMVIDLESVKQV